MYPIITIGSQNISMTGLGRIVALATFLFVVYYSAPSKNLQFRKVFYWLPWAIIVPYLMGSYVSFFLTRGQLTPYSLQDIGIILSPFNFQFHIVGILLGICIAVIIFFRSIHSKKEQYQRIEVFSKGFALALIPLGIFLVMGDTFIGIPSNAGRETFRGDISRRSALGKVLPIGVMLSATGLISRIITYLIQKSYPAIKRGYVLLAMLLGGIAITTLFQHSPRYGIMAVRGITLDIKAYTAFLLSMLCLQQFFLQFKYDSVTRQ